MMAHFIWDIDESRRKKHVPSKPDEFVAHCEALNRMDRGRKRARLKSPEILASKERLRLNRRDKAIARRTTPMAEREPIGYVAGVRPSHT